MEKERQKGMKIPRLLSFISRLFFVHLGLQNPNVRKVAVKLVIIQPIAHHKLIGDGETHIVGGDGLTPAGRLVQQGTQLQRGRIPGLEELEKVA